MRNRRWSESGLWNATDNTMYLFLSQHPSIYLSASHISFLWLKCAWVLFSLLQCPFVIRHKATTAAVTPATSWLSGWLCHCFFYTLSEHFNHYFTFTAFPRRSAFRPKLWTIHNENTWLKKQAYFQNGNVCERQPIRDVLTHSLARQNSSSFFFIQN